MKNQKHTRNIVDQSALPEYYPTHYHGADFWEILGRAVATFGFLEEVLTKAIFALTATRNYDESEIEKAYAEWLPKLKKSLSDQLGGLINTYGKSVRDNADATIANLDELLIDLRKASNIRNVLCHGSWRMPDENGAAIPFFVNKKEERFDTPIDVLFLSRVQRHTVDLICAVINSVTHMGWQFPGSCGPGERIWKGG